jgi:hypothetical protein
MEMIEADIFGNSMGPLPEPHGFRTEFRNR